MANAKFSFTPDRRPDNENLSYKQEKSTEKQPKLKSKKKNNKNKNNKKRLKLRKQTRTIKVAHRNLKRFLFYCALFIMAVIFINAMIQSARLNKANKLLARKQISITQVKEAADDQTGKASQMVFAGYDFLRQYINVSNDEEERNSRTEALKGYYASGFELDGTEQGNDTARKLISIQFIRRQNKTNKKIGKYIELTYDVEYETGNQIYDYQFVLPVIYKKSKLNLINYPRIIRITDKGKTDFKYDEGNFESVETPVDDDTAARLTTFTKHFLKLYASNDDNLNLISSVKGLGELKATNIAVLGINKISRNKFDVTVKTTLQSKHSDSWKSFYDLVVVQNGSKFYVQKIK